MNWKIKLFIVAFFLMGAAGWAQTSPNGGNADFQTVFGRNSGALGGYVSLGLGNTVVNDNHALLGQMRLAVRLDHSLSLGIAGAGFTDWIYGVNEDRPDWSPDGYNIQGGYGGLFIEPVFAPRFPVHLAFPIVFGVGGVVFTEENDNWDNWDDNANFYVLDRDVFFVIEPGVELEFNLSPFIRMGTGVNYRFTSMVEIDRRNEHLLNGASVFINVKAGIF